MAGAGDLSGDHQMGVGQARKDDLPEQWLKRCDVARYEPLAVAGIRSAACPMGKPLGQANAPLRDC